MPPRTDNAHLSEAQICELVGTSQQRRQAWVSRKLLRKTRKSGCGLRDALELAQLLRLIEVLGPTDAVVAWGQVREQCASPFPTATLDVIFDLELKTAAVLTDSAGVRAVIEHGRPVRLVTLAPRRAEITVAFRRVVDSRREAEPPKRRKPGPRATGRAGA
jgi:hypothetical protein